MSDFLRILYVNAGPTDEPDLLQSELEVLRDKTWGKTAHARWEVVAAEGINEIPRDRFQLAIVAWPKPKDASGAVTILKTIRERVPSLKVLVIRADDVAHDDCGLQLFAKDDLVRSIMRQQFVGDAWGDFRVKWPPVRLRVADQPQNPDVRDMIQSIGKKRLELTLQKFFPDASSATIYPVTGGWSGTGLCRAFLDGRGEMYYVKLFDKRAEYEAELLNHREAEQWLGPGEAIVNLRLIPELGPDVRGQFEAFPGGPPYAICYDSASTSGNQRETLECVYRGETRGQSAEDPETFVTKTVLRLLDILTQQRECHTEPRMPWIYREGQEYRVPSKMRRGILTATTHLRSRLSATDEWKRRADRLRSLVYELPPWLEEVSRPARVGYIHGDPNARNTLVALEMADDVRLIDCGRYTKKGSLVCDLALIERDLKLLLMATEPEAGPYFDLDVTQVARWCRAEQRSIELGLDYTSENAPTGPPNESVWDRLQNGVFPLIREAVRRLFLPHSAGAPVPTEGTYLPEARAYRLIGAVRQRARAICPPEDAEGRHYFGALLYWTLEALQHEAIKPTKKLLAIYSATAILDRFDHC